MMAVDIREGGCFAQVGPELVCASPVDPAGERACEYESSAHISSSREHVHEEQVSASVAAGELQPLVVMEFSVTATRGYSYGSEQGSASSSLTYLFGRTCQRQYLHITGFGDGDRNTLGSCAYSEVRVCCKLPR